MTDTTAEPTISMNHQREEKTDGLATLLQQMNKLTEKQETTKSPYRDAVKNVENTEKETQPNRTSVEQNLREIAKPPPPKTNTEEAQKLSPEIKSECAAKRQVDTNALKGSNDSANQWTRT